MSLTTDSTKYVVESSKRLSGTNENFTYRIDIPKSHTYSHVCLLQAIIPKSYYMIAEPYNTFILTENAVATLITIKPGNYNVISWINLISAQLNASTTQGWFYSISFPDSVKDVDTGKFTYTVKQNTGQPSFTFSANTNVYEQFGFAASSTNTFTEGSINSVNVVKFQQEDVIYIHSDIATSTTMNDNSDLLQEIYASSTPTYSNVVYALTGGLEAYSKKVGSISNNVYRFTLTDEQNRVLNLNGLNCVFTILIYQKDMINKVLANSILNNFSSPNI